MGFRKEVRISYSPMGYKLQSPWLAGKKHLKNKSPGEGSTGSVEFKYVPKSRKRTWTKVLQWYMPGGFMKNSQEGSARFCQKPVCLWSDSNEWREMHMYVGQYTHTHKMLSCWTHISDTVGIPPNSEMVVRGRFWSNNVKLYLSIYLI